MASQRLDFIPLRRRFRECELRFRLLKEVRDALWDSGYWPGCWKLDLFQTFEFTTISVFWEAWLKRWGEHEPAGHPWPVQWETQDFKTSPPAWSLHLATTYVDALGELGYAAGMAEGALGLAFQISTSPSHEFRERN
jgi:hypothetical protein